MQFESLDLVDFRGVACSMESFKRIFCKRILQNLFCRRLMTWSVDEPCAGDRAKNSITDSQTTMHNTAWWKCIGCFQLQVSFRKKAANYRALLWNMTYEYKASYASSPPCIKYWRLSDSSAEHVMSLLQNMFSRIRLQKQVRQIALNMLHQIRIINFDQKSSVLRRL